MERLLKFFTEERLAQKCGVSQSAISRWARGARKPDFQRRMVLLKCFSIALDAWDQPANQTAEGS